MAQASSHRFGVIEIADALLNDELLVLIHLVDQFPHPTGINCCVWQG